MKYFDWFCLIVGDGVWNEDGMYFFLFMIVFEMCFCVWLNIWSVNVVIVYILFI